MSGRGLSQRRAQQRHDRPNLAAPSCAAGRTLPRRQLRHYPPVCEGLSLCTRGHSFRRDDIDMNVFCFAERAHAEQFRNRFGGEFIDPNSRPKMARSARVSSRCAMAIATLGQLIDAKMALVAGKYAVPLGTDEDGIRGYQAVLPISIAALEGL